MAEPFKGTLWHVTLVFIEITTDRLSPDKQHIGRRIALCAALMMRVAFYV
jgi:hypothetical protein